MFQPSQGELISCAHGFLAPKEQGSDRRMHPTPPAQGNPPNRLAIRPNRKGKPERNMTVLKNHPGNPKGKPKSVGLQKSRQHKEPTWVVSFWLLGRDVGGCPRASSKKHHQPVMCIYIYIYVLLRMPFSGWLEGVRKGTTLHTQALLHPNQILSFLKRHEHPHLPRAVRKGVCVCVLPWICRFFMFGETLAKGKPKPHENPSNST